MNNHSWRRRVQRRRHEVQVRSLCDEPDQHRLPFHARSKPRFRARQLIREGNERFERLARLQQLRQIVYLLGGRRCQTSKVRKVPLLALGLQRVPVRVLRARY